MRSLSFMLASAGALLLGACEFSTPSSNRETDRFHARTFDWNAHASSPLAKASPARAPSTAFATREELGEALRALQRELEHRGASDSLWKPLDHACPSLDLALWNRHGEVRLRDSLILDEALLKARCVAVSEQGALEKSAAYSTGESQHRAYPYKMLGRAWSDLDLFITRSAGAETQFKKDREYLGMTGWWDTDATRIGVRIYLLDCGGTPTVCYSGGEKSNWHRNSSSVLQTDFAPWNETRVQTTNLPAGIKRLNLRVSSAVLAFHSADHAGIRFRAVSSAGLSSAIPLYGMPATGYVTW